VYSGEFSKLPTGRSAPYLRIPDSLRSREFGGDKPGIVYCARLVVEDGMEGKRKAGKTNGDLKCLSRLTSGQT
jgi:hypothetical protein